MLIVPLRCAPPFGATTTLTAPLPVPELAPPKVSQAALLNDVQAQPVAVVTDTDVVSPAAGELRIVGVRPKVHAVVAACVTVSVSPPMVTVPVRCAPVLPATTTVTVPSPVPEAPAVTISQFALLAAVQAQVLVVVTATGMVSPIEGEFLVDGEIENVHDVVAACVTVNGWPAISIVPVRCDSPVLAATAIVTLPSPVPDPPALTVSHDALLVVVQAQALPAVTETDVDSPAAGEFRVLGAIA